MPNYDVTCPLSHEIDRNRRLSNESKCRLNCGFEQFNQGLTKKILLTGGIFGSLIEHKINIPFSDIARKYALERGIPEEVILTEDWTKETVLQGITLAIFAESLKWKDLQIVTSDYHEPRVREIFDYVSGDRFNLNIKTIPTEKKNDLKTQQKERESLEAFF